MTLRVLTVGALILAALSGCAGASRRGATVLFASGADLQSINPLVTLHPLARQVQRYVLLTTLAQYDSALVPRPYLARTWTWSADRRELRFVLRPVRWHDGVPTTAHDVAFTLDAARDPATGYPRLTDLAGVTGVRAEGDSVVVVRFASAQTRFPDVLTDLAIVPRHRLEGVERAGMRRAAWNEAPIGNGPFRFVAHETNRRWVFTRNPDFPAEMGGPPRLERFIVVVVDEPTTKLAALTAGELDFAGIQPAHAEFVRRDRALRAVDYPLLFTYALVFNRTRPPFDRADYRRAVALAVDRQEIVDGYLYGFGRPAWGAVPPEVPGYVSLPPLPYAPDSARRLAGATPPRFEVLTVGSGEAALEQMLQAQLAEAGIGVTIRQLELSAFLDRVYGPRREFDAAVLGVSGDLALGHLAPLLRLSGPGAPDDPAAAQRFAADSLPVTFLYHARGLQGMNARVHGVRLDLRGELATLRDWWVDAP